jgi:hypothetical protein
MHPRIRELLDYVDAQRRVLATAVDEVPAPLHGINPEPARWSVAQVLDHLAIVETRVAQVIALRVGAARQEGVPEEREMGSVVAALDLARLLDRSRKFIAPEAIRPRRGVATDEAWAALERSRAVFREAVLAGDGLALGTVTHPHPAFGPLTLYEWIAFVGGHEARHADQIREIGRAFAQR